jgi:hypothetical protein
LKKNKKYKTYGVCPAVGPGVGAEVGFLVGLPVRMGI